MSIFWLASQLMIGFRIDYARVRNVSQKKYETMESSSWNETFATVHNNQPDYQYI